MSQSDLCFLKTLHLRLRRNYCDLRCPLLSKTIGGDADVAYSQISGGDISRAGQVRNCGLAVAEYF